MIKKKVALAGEGLSLAALEGHGDVMKTHTKGVMPWDVAHRVISCHRVSSSHSSIGGDRFNVAQYGSICFDIV